MLCSCRAVDHLRKISESAALSVCLLLSLPLVLFLLLRLDQKKTRPQAAHVGGGKLDNCKLIFFPHSPHRN